MTPTQTALPRGITVTPERTIQIAFTWRGRHYRERLALRPTESHIEYADKKRQAILFDIERGRFNFENHFPDSPRARTAGGKRVPSVDEALRAYLRQRRRQLAPSTIRDYRSAINSHLIPAFGRRRLDELTVAEIREWIAGVEISSQRIGKVLVPLRAVFADAVSDEIVERDPLARVRVPIRAGSVTAGPDPLTPKEVSRVLAHCEPTHARYFACAIGTGLRTSELLALRWEDINLAAGYLEVRRALVNGALKAPKTDAGLRRVVLMPLAWQALRAQQAGVKSAREPVWRNSATGEHLQSSQQVRRTWQRACERAAVRYRRPYNCRHTYASWLLTAGEDPSWIAHQMGHRDWSMIRRTYARWMPSVRPDAGVRAAKVFDLFSESNGGLNDGTHAHRESDSWSRSAAADRAQRQPPRAACSRGVDSGTMSNWFAMPT